MHMKTQMISARIRARAKGFSSRRYMSYGLAALVPAMGLVGAGKIGDPSLTGFGVGAMLVVVVLAYCLGVRNARISRPDALFLLMVYATVTAILAVV